MGKLRSLAALFFISFSLLAASQTEIGIRVHPQVSSAEGISYNAFSLFIEKNQDLSSSAVLSHAMDLGVNRLSAYASYRSGLYAQILQNDVMLFAVGAEMEQGIQFFRPHPLYILSMGPQMRLRIKLFKDAGVGLRLSAAHVLCPAYAYYSSLYAWNEVSLGFTYCFPGISQKKKNN